MATEKTTEILEFKVEQGAAIKDLERAKLSIIGLKEEQQKLTRAYKQGDLTQKEYAQELVRTEAVLKRETAQYGMLQKSVAGVETSMDKLIKSNEKLAKSTEETNKKQSESEKGLEQIAGRMKDFLVPATAAVAVVGALAKAYVSSAAGARDLKSAQDQLGASVTFLQNKLASLLGADGKGGGLLSGLAFRLNLFLGGAEAAARGLISASAKNALDEFRLVELEGQRAAKSLLDYSEVQRQIRDDDTRGLEERLEAAKAVEFFVNERERKLLEVQDEKLGKLRLLLALDKDNLDLQIAIREAEFEIADIQEDSQGKRSEALNGIRALNKELKEYNKELKGTYQNENDLAKLREDAALEFLKTKRQIKSEDLKIETDFGQQSVAIQKKFAKQIADIEETQNKNLSDIRIQRLQIIGGGLADLSNLFAGAVNANKAFAVSQIAVDTAITLSGLQKAAASQPTPTSQALAYAAGYIRVLANLRQIYGLLNESTPVSGGTVYTASGGQQFAISGTGQVSTLSQDIAKQQRNAQRNADLNSSLSLIGTGAAIGSVVPGVGTVVGAVVGGLVAGTKLLIKGIRNLFAEGGYTGDGGKYEPAGLVHKGEVVWSQRDVAAVGGPEVANSIRPTFNGYADGGIVSPIGLTSSDIQNIIKSMPPVYASWKEARTVGRRLELKESISSR